MKSTQMIVGAIVVIAVTVICSTEGIPRPQKDYFEVNGFAFDGPVDRSRSSSSTKTPPIVVPTFTPPLATPSSTPPTDTQIPVTESPEVTQCTQDCRYQVTSEYNPVCGTDRSVYSNPGMLNCAKACGRDVNQAYTGPCTSLVRG